MGLFGSKSEHHETPCKPSGFGWPQNQKNPMGWGSDKPRKLDGGKGGKTSHGSRAEKNLLNGRGALIRQNSRKVNVSGEKPGKGKRRP
jgi:hypothetical protein